MDIELIYFNFISYFYAKLGCGPTIYDLNLNNESFYRRANCKYMYILPSGAKKNRIVFTHVILLNILICGQVPIIDLLNHTTKFDL